MDCASAKLVFAYVTIESAVTFKVLYRKQCKDKRERWLDVSLLGDEFEITNMYIYKE